MSPVVSICLPNLNTRPFLPARLDSILAQTLTDWELIVCDSHSDDGSWEFFCTYAGDARVHLHQVPREGIYAGWNECIRRARGTYVYIATSDDTMSPTCLEQMVAALERHPQCELAVCEFDVIDEAGQIVPGMWEGWAANRYLGATLDQEHVRTPPLDALVGCALDTTCISITQVLTRRTLYERIGRFSTCFGPWGDFEWHIRTGLLCARVHVPARLATWRRRSAQATDWMEFTSTRWHRAALCMISFAYHAAVAVDPGLASRVSLSALRAPHACEFVRASLRDAGQGCRSWLAAARALVEQPVALASFLRQRSGSEPGGLGPAAVERLLEQSGLPPIRPAAQI